MSSGNNTQREKHLPRVTSGEVFPLLEAENISRLHVGKDPMSYAAGKRIVQMAKAGILKHLGVKEWTITETYWNMTRKERREYPIMRETVLLTVRTAFLKEENRRLDEEISKMKRQIKNTRK
jgi:hypothetical protein